MEITEDQHPLILGREIIAVVNREARVGVTAADAVGALRNLRDHWLVDARARVVGVIGNRLNIVVGERIEMLAGLTLITGAGQNVVKVRNHAGRIEEFAAGIEIQPPRIARAFGEHLEDLASRVEAPNTRINFHALFVGRTWAADDGMREDAVVTIEPAVGPPDKAVQSLVRIM